MTSGVVEVDGPLSQEFQNLTEYERKLCVIIFSHDTGFAANDYSCCIREICSYGALIISIDHHDGTCSYTINQNTKDEVIFNDKIKLDDMDG
jgi:hypothetical protein